MHFVEILFTDAEKNLRYEIICTCLPLNNSSSASCIQLFSAVALENQYLALIYFILIKLNTGLNFVICGDVTSINSDNVTNISLYYPQFFSLVWKKL